MSVTNQYLVQSLFDDYRVELLRFFQVRVRCPHKAADLLQETFLRLTQSNKLHHVDNLKDYLFRTAYHLVCDHHRSQVRSAKIFCDRDSLPIEAIDPRSAERVIIGEEDLWRFSQALRELSPLCQRIFYLNRFEGLKHRRIAEQLNISRRTVEDNLKRALLHCSRRLEEA